MTEYQAQLLKKAIEVGALKFGEFTLKSGRISPYFFNAGAFCDGESLATLAQSYAEVIARWINEEKGIDVLFGPAYKGIPLVAAISVCLATKYHINLPWAFNRKEIKDHGEGGIFVGAEVKGKQILIIDDVLTAGTAVKQSIDLLIENQALPIGLLVALDRQETIVNTSVSALEQIHQQNNIFTEAVINLDNLADYIKENSQFAAHYSAMENYRKEYGIRR